METSSRRLGRDRRDEVEEESSSSDEYETAQSDSDSDQSTDHLPPTQAPLEAPNKSIVQQKTSFKDDIPTYYETVPTLQNMSSTAVAIELWRQVLRDPDFEDGDSLEYTSTIERANDFLFELPVPGLIRDCIGNYLPQVRHEMMKWFRDHKKFLGEPAISDMLYCSLLYDGKIDYRASALSMLSNPKLAQDDKFKIMSIYCLEEEIKKFSVKSLSSKFTKSIPRSHPLLYYWLCYMKGDLNKLRKQYEASIASQAITWCDTWSAIEYFWDQLTADEQISNLETILDISPEFQKNLFFKMSESQKIRIISKIPIKIMKNFWYQPGQEKFAFQTWIYIRNFVNHEQFQEIMKIITSHKRSAWDIEDKCRYLADIWNHCPDHLKNLAYEPPIRNMILGYGSGWKDCSYNGIEFLTDYVSHFDAEFREKLIFEQPWAFVSFLDQSVTDRLIKLCLPDSKNVERLKKMVLASSTIQKFLRNIIKQNDDFDAVDKFMDYFCPDSRTRAGFCFDVFSRFTHWSDLFSERGTTKFNNLSRFLSDNVENTLPDRFEQLHRQFGSMYFQYIQQFSGPKI